MTIAIICRFPKPQGLAFLSVVLAVLVSVPERPAFKASSAPACDWGALSVRLDTDGESGELEGDSVLIGWDETGLLVEDSEGSL